MIVQRFLLKSPTNFHRRFQWIYALMFMMEVEHNFIPEFLLLSSKWGGGAVCPPYRLRSPTFSLVSYVP